MASLSPQAASLADALAPAMAPAPLPPAAAGAAVAPPPADMLGGLAGPAPIPADNLAGAPAPAFPSIDPQMIQLLMAEIMAAQAGDQEQLAAAQQEALLSNPIFLQLLGMVPPPGAGLDGQATGSVQMMPSEQLVLGGQ